MPLQQGKVNSLYEPGDVIRVPWVSNLTEDKLYLIMSEFPTGARLPEVC
jgi:hypothetical protein